jgi:lipopolysaccharide transport system ATP-binding protein
MRPALSISNLSKRYQIGARQSGGYRTLRESIMGAIAAPINRLRSWGKQSAAEGSARVQGDVLWALRDVGFEINPGEAVGIIGQNGAGKSTLLKLLSRITEPTSGRMEIRGRLGGLLEVGTGFHPELTGRENIYLNGSILGMTQREIARKFDDIVDFAEIAEFIDTPVKRYSSGMYVRLGFAVAAHMVLDVLLIDEVLAVGDYRFQRKCLEYAKSLRNRAATVLIVSHNMFSIKSMCERVIYLSQGSVKHDGSPEKGIALYENDGQLTAARWAADQVGTNPAQFPIRATRVESLDEDGAPKTLFDHGERMRLRIQFQAKERIANPNVIVAFIRSDNVVCCNFTTQMDGVLVPPIEGSNTVELLTPPLKLVAEMYTIQVLVRDAITDRLYCAQTGCTFHVRHEYFNTHYGVFHEAAEWSCREATEPCAP